MIGAGGIAGAHAASWRSLGVEPLVWSDLGAPELVERHGGRLAPSLDALLAEVDVVDICTPTPTHAELVLRAIDAGVHVICEKPVARTAAQALELLRAAEAAGVLVYPAHVVRWFPEHVALRDAVAAGRLGELAVLRFTRGGQAPSRDWFFDEDASGGIVLDQMLHDLDQARWIAGEVVEVFAAQSPAVVGGVVPRQVVAHVVLTHASGAISFAQGVWGGEGMRFETTFDVAGSRGRLQFDSGRAVEVTSNVPADGAASYLPPVASGDPYAAELAELLAACTGGPEPRVSLRDGIVAVALGEAAIASARAGEAVPFDERAVLAGEVVR